MECNISYDNDDAVNVAGIVRESIVDGPGWS